MSASNTNATTEAITNYLNGGSSNTGWSSTAVANVTSGFNSYTAPMINNASRNTPVASYGPASTSGQAKVGIYYNYCAATVGTYCYASDGGVDIPDTIIDAAQDICPANWRMPTGGTQGEYAALFDKYNNTQNATDASSLQYSLSTPLSGAFNDNTADYQGLYGDWWSSTNYNTSSMRLLYASSTTVGPFNYYGRYGGLTIRCLVSN